MTEAIEHCLLTCVDAVCIWKACGLEYILPSSSSVELFGWCRDV
ncbi:hypothetical protein A2U01_0064542, partial [Trifolium medium]|nr:hypothetical protein [Trifolium medium]